MEGIENNNRRTKERNMKLIRTILLIAVAFAIFKVYSAQAADSAAQTIAENPQLFRAGEFQLDTFGSGKIEDLSNLSDIPKGAGVGINYFPWRTAGFGIEGRG